MKNSATCLLAVVVLATASFGIAAGRPTAGNDRMGDRMTAAIPPATSFPAWVYNFPGFDAPKGTRINILSFELFRPGSKEASFVIVSDAGVAPRFAQLLQQKRLLASLRIVVRQDPKTELDYSFYDVNVLEVNAEAMGVKVKFGFGKGEAQMGRNLNNPGPPAGAPEVSAEPPNSGWIYGLASSPVAIAVQEVAPKTSEGILRIRLAVGSEIPAELRALLMRGAWSGELILVLPDTTARKYVEYKLWDGKISAAGRDLFFSAPVLIHIP